MRLVRALLLPLPLVVAACATGPRFDMSGVDPQVGPAQAVAEIEQRRGARVVWGGTIINTLNLADSTRIEVLAYPLDSAQRPRTARSPQGRFLIEYPGYLESADYAAGREITVSGVLTETREGRIGEAGYRYPLVTAERLYLWDPRAQREGPRVSFGVGVIIGR